MSLEENDIEIRSEVVQEILGLVPNWMIRWGNALILLLVFGMLWISFLIKYPDTMLAEVTLGTKNNTKNIYAPISGEFSSITVKDGDSVNAKQVVGSIRNAGESAILSTSNTGKIYFVGLWVLSTKISKGDLIFKIAPSAHDHYIGIIHILEQKASKIRIGQKVKIRILEGSNENYHIIEGSVFNQTSVPNEFGYITVEIKIGDRLISINNEEVVYKPGIKGSAEIVLEDMRLIERLLYGIRNIFK